ncbi:MAG: glycosyltransferase family 4 protein [Rhodocyclaceae bacterium]|nr:glycosyltransferase family 4 protein [Rhodocyclaceae bacterium]
MKVLLTVHQFFPEHTSGTEVLTLETARGLIARGHQVKVVTSHYRSEALTDDQRFDRYEFQGIEVERLAFSPSPMGGDFNLTRLEYCNPLFAVRFAQIVDDFRPDIVHFCHLMRLSATFVDVCRERRIPVVLTPTDFWFVCPYAQLMLPDHSACEGPDPRGLNCIRHFMHTNRKASMPYALAANVPDLFLRAGLSFVRHNLHLRLRLPGVFRTLGESARAVADRQPFLRERLASMDRILVPNRFMWDVLIRYGMAAERAVLQPFGINLDYQCGVEHTPSKVLRIGFIGTVARHKGAHVLVEAVKQIPGLACKVKIYGRLTDDPDYTREIQSRAQGDDRIQFLGGFPNCEIGRIFSELDVLVVPSIWLENTPLVIYSAQASGCPVIGSDVGGIGSAVAHEQNGLLFPPGDVPALAQQIRRMIEDPEFVKRLGQAARKPVSMQEYCAEVERHYEELTGDPQCAAS